MEDQPLRCNWLIPSDFNGVLRNYSIKVKHDGQLIHSGFSNGPSYKKKPDILMTEGQNYEVIVSAMTHAEGSPASTKVNFVVSGKWLA